MTKFFFRPSIITTLRSDLRRYSSQIRLVSRRSCELNGQLPDKLTSTFSLFISELSSVLHRHNERRIRCTSSTTLTTRILLSFIYVRWNIHIHKTDGTSCSRKRKSPFNPLRLSRVRNICNKRLKWRRAGHFDA